MTCKFQLTDDLPYLYDAPKMLLLVFSLIKCKHLKGQTPGTFRWGSKKCFLQFFILPGYQILTDIFKMVNKDPADGTLNLKKVRQVQQAVQPSSELEQPGDRNSA